MFRLTMWLTIWLQYTMMKGIDIDALSNPSRSSYRHCLTGVVLDSSGN